MRVALVALSIVFFCHYVIAAEDLVLDWGSSAHVCRGEPCVQPNTTITIWITAQNIGTSNWTSSSIHFKFVTTSCNETNDCWTDAVNNDLILTQENVAPGQNGIFSGTLLSPDVIGKHFWVWRAYDVGSSAWIGDSVEADVEVTCSDGVFCNGAERYVAGKCVNGPSPCDDGYACATPVCDESLARCSYVLNTTTTCDTCLSTVVCTPNCTNKICGEDGCDGSCGSCNYTEACTAEGQCVQSMDVGTCRNPIVIWTKNMSESLYAERVYYGDNSQGVGEVFPSCNIHSMATELIYYFEIPPGATVGLDARSHGIDSVLDLRKDSCFDGNSTVGCSDDSSPPGDYGSRIAMQLTEGSYFLIVDAYNLASTGPFELTIRFLRDGCVPLCDGKFCGDDGCGQQCGACDADQHCNTTHARCQDNVCIRNCTDKECGDDGCGGSCGTCTSGTLCVLANNTCQSFPYCNHFRPVCPQGCAAGEYCGSDCKCYGVNEPVPDLVIDKDELTNQIVFENKFFTPESCAVAENCIGDIGMRRVMRFNVLVVNQGLAALEPPDPATRPDLFQWSPCHGHYHFQTFADYQLLSENGTVVLQGRKQAYCMLDSGQALPAPHVPCSSSHDCTNQGILPGWSDVYTNDLDCQWLDITDTPPGDYLLRVYSNTGRIFHEGSFENNIVTTTVTIPPNTPTTSTTGMPSMSSTTSTTEAQQPTVSASTVAVPSLVAFVFAVVIALLNL